MRTIIRWTLWQRRWSTMWWSFGVFAFVFINMIFYPTFKNDAEELQKSFENLPDAAVQLFGGSTDFFSPIGFLNSQVYFLMLPLLLGILAIGLGSGLLAREEQDKTIESLLSRPVSRGRLLLGKSLAGVLILSMVTAVALVTVLGTAYAVDLEVSGWRILAVTLVCGLLALSFGALALLLTAVGKARAAALGVATVVALGGYLISSLAGTVAWLKGPSKILPFEYYQSEAILRGTYQSANLLFFAGVLLVCAVLSYLFFRRRDLS